MIWPPILARHCIVLMPISYHIAAMAPSKLPKKVASRRHQIYADYLQLLDEHLADVWEGRVDRMKHIKDFAHDLHIHPVHLSATIKEVTGGPPCADYEAKIMDIARQQLLTSTDSIGNIARRLTYDPSNFTKFFKHFEGLTPKQYRQQAENT